MIEQRTPGAIVTPQAAADWTGVIHRLGAVVSTMDEARLHAPGAPHGTVLVATEQHGGRGREGRRWVSRPGNLYATAILRPGGDARNASQLAFLVANAVADAVDRLAGPGATLKWPNDVLHGGAKLAGMLLETAGNGVVLAGIGVNVAHSPTGMPYPVTSLAALGCSAEVDDVLAAVIAALQAEWSAWRAEGFGPVLERWARRGPPRGSSLAVQLGTARVVGRFAGLRHDGALLLDTADGLRAVVAGDVQPCATGADGG